MTRAVVSAIEQAADRAGLDPLVVQAIVQVESGGNHFATRPEYAYRWLWDVQTGKPFRRLTAHEAASKQPPGDFPCLAGSPIQEWWGQQTSWGLMQVMGAVAREHGYPHPYLASLSDPTINLEIGCAHFKRYLTRFQGDIGQALRAYNGGLGGLATSQTAAYARKVEAILAGLRG